MYFSSTSVKNSADLLSWIGGIIDQQYNLGAIANWKWERTQDLSDLTGTPTVAQQSGLIRRLQISTNTGTTYFTLDAVVNPSSAGQGNQCGIAVNHGGPGAFWDQNPDLGANKRSVWANDTYPEGSPTWYSPVTLDVYEGSVGLYEWTNFLETHFFLHEESLSVVIELKKDLFVHLAIYRELQPLPGGSGAGGFPCVMANYYPGFSSRWHYPYVANSGGSSSTVNSQGTSRISMAELPGLLVPDPDRNEVWLGSNAESSSFFDSTSYPVIYPCLDRYDTYGFRRIMPGGHVSKYGGTGAYGKTLAHPIRVFSIKDAPEAEVRKLATPLFEYPNILGINLKQIPPKYTFIDNGDEYVCFPIYTKSSGSVAQTSNPGCRSNIGLALRK